MTTVQLGSLNQSSGNSLLGHLTMPLRQLPLHSQFATEPEPSSSAARGYLEELVFTLTVIWQSGEPSRLGESLIIPMSIQGHTRVFGRGTDHAKDPFPRLHLVRYRPIETHVAAVLDNQHISRIQLLLRPMDAERLQVENVGLCELFHNGRLAQTAEVRSGDILRLGKQLSLVATRRLLGAFSPGLGYDAFDFGTADSAGIVGESIATWKLRMDLAFVASRAGHVLIHGASGTGKELVAQAIHRLSPSVERPLVSRSAATIPEALVDAELFGNAKNYPNPGMSDRPGLIGEANNSTLFLDEFAELPPEAQAHLLRVLDHGEYQRLGETTRRQSVFRLVAATNRPLSAIKEDVLARFSFRIHTSPLNDRREDIPTFHCCCGTCCVSWQAPNVSRPVASLQAAIHLPTGKSRRNSSKRWCGMITQRAIENSSHWPCKR